MTTPAALVLVVLPLGLPPAAAGPAAPAAGELEWNARNAEHLLNRAGFGGAPEEIARVVALGPEAAVDELLRGPGSEGAVPFGERGREVRSGVYVPEALTEGPPVELGPPAATTKRFYLDRGVRENLERNREYCSDWIDSMLRGADPVRDRMALFWHGHFVSEFMVVGNARDMVAQARFLRTNALGSFETLVRGIARDPAMLEYLNNNVNEKTHPNENWARELMELFTLGEGNYTEDDIKEAARAYTGWADRDHEFAYNRHLHDYGPKTVLGVTGNLDGDDVIDVLLAREGCARFLAWKLLAYFEGVEPSPERTEKYAAALRESGYHVEALLRRLFLDPDFYRDEVVGTRVTAPIEYFVGMARRLGIHPPRHVIFVASSLLGHRLFDPPNVKGWEEGIPWMTTGSIMQRSNLVGALFGVLGREDEAPAADIFNAKVEERGREFTLYEGPFVDYLAMLAWYQATGWRPLETGFADAIAAAEPASDEELVEALLGRLLAIPTPPSSAERVHAELAAWRAEEGLASGSLLEAGDRGTALLVRLAHVILSLPEAQLH